MRNTFEKMNDENISGTLDYVNKILGFCLHQPSKDIEGRVRVVDSEIDDVVTKREFLDSYVPLIKYDENRDVHIYNALIVYALTNLGCPGTFSGSEHIAWENRNYLFKTFVLAVRGRNAEKIYSEESFLGETENLFPTELCAEFDIIRVAILLMRNVAPCEYKGYKIIFEELYNAMNNILSITLKDALPNITKQEILENVIRLCFETFAYPCSVDRDGMYFPFRDDLTNARISYTTEPVTDSMNAISLAMGYSFDTVRLYGVFQHILYEWLLLEKRRPVFSEPDVEDVFTYKSAVVKETFENISSSFCRISDGFNVFCDFYSKRYLSVRIWENIDKDIEKKLCENRSLLRRGFDNRMKNRAGEMALQIVAAVKTSKTPINLIRLVLNPEYPLSDFTYFKLRELNFAHVIAKHKSISKLDKSHLCSYLVYDLFSSKNKNELVFVISETVSMLLDNASFPETSLQSIYENISLAYIFSLCDCALNDSTDLCFEKISEIYERLRHNIHKNSAPEQIVASFFYDFVKTGKAKTPSSDVVLNFLYFVREVLSVEEKVNTEGFLYLCKMAGKDKLYTEIKNELYNFGILEKDAENKENLRS